MDAGRVTRTLPGGRSAPLLPVVVRQVGEPPGRSVLLEGGTIVVGAARECQLVVDDPSVSRRHLEVTLVAEGVALRDLGSRNGTFYRGQRVERMVLVPDDQVQVGGTTVRVEIDRDALRATGDEHGAQFRGMVGASEGMRRLFALVERLDGSLVPVLLLGESGTGKELVARALHEGSRVAKGPFVPLNCGAVPRELVASILFGHRRGAFTGAHGDRTGVFASAEHGTLFLDEVGELPLDVQPMLLRAIEYGEITRVGDDTARAVRVRVVAATNRDLEADVSAGRFREDLYFRLAVVPVRLPPLRERREDVPTLARFFARQEGGDLPDEVVAELAQRPLPGNVRELRNLVLAYSAIGVLPAGRARPDALRAALGEAVDPARPFPAQRDAVADLFTTIYFERLLATTGGNLAAAAKVAGVDRSYVSRLVAKLGGRAPK